MCPGVRPAAERDLNLSTCEFHSTFRCLSFLVFLVLPAAERAAGRWIPPCESFTLERKPRLVRAIHHQAPDDSYPCRQKCNLRVPGPGLPGRATHLIKVLPDSLPQPLQVHGRTGAGPGRAFPLPAGRTWIPTPRRGVPRPGPAQTAPGCDRPALPLQPDPAPEVLSKRVPSGA